MEMIRRFPALAWILAALVVAPAAAQRVGVTTATSKPQSKRTTPPKSVEERLADIEKRLDELENGDIEKLESDKEDDLKRRADRWRTPRHEWSGLCGGVDGIARRARPLHPRRRQGRDHR
jgi:hypothetical protein